MSPVPRPRPAGSGRGKDNEIPGVGRVSSNSVLLAPSLSHSNSNSAWPPLSFSPPNCLLCSRGSCLQGAVARRGLPPSQVGGMKLMTLQVESIQLKLLPCPSLAHSGSPLSEPVTQHDLFLPISLACESLGSTFSHWGSWHRSRDRKMGSLHLLTLPVALGSCC